MHQENDVDLRIVEGIAWLLSKPKRIKIAVGSRGSAKSIGVGDCMLMFADQGERICCTREFQNSIDDSVHESLKTEIDRLGIEQSFDIQASKILANSGGELFYKGLAPAAANEEGEDPPEIWITMNRGSKEDAVAKKYLARAEEELARCGRYEDEMMMVVELNYRDNPWFPPELEMERQDDLKHMSEAEYLHVWEGHYYDEVDFSIIKQSWFDAAIDAHLREGRRFEPVGQKVLAYDPADQGSDAKAYAIRHGSVFLDIQQKRDGDFIEGFKWALEAAIIAQVDVFTWDGDGMGIGGKLQVQQALQGKRVEQIVFKGSEGPDFPDLLYMPNENDSKANSKSNKDTFKNKRAQYYVLLKDRFFNTYRAVVKGDYVDPDKMISLSSSIPNLRELRAEVCRIPEKPGGSNGRIQILSKQEMLKMEIKSPNMADAMMMAMVSPNVRRKPVIRDVPVVNYFG
jgi:phage terminase large subunit